MFPGIGYGGSCFPKDVQALYKSGKENGYEFRILDSVMNVNQHQKTALIPKIMEYYDGDIEGKNVALWGLSFKPDTDDIREAPSLYIIEELLKAGAKISAYDPEAMSNVQERLGDKIRFALSAYEACENADFLVIATEWAAFRNPNFKKISSLLLQNIIFDGRNLYDLNHMEEEGFDYISIGRRKVFARK